MSDVASEVVRLNTRRSSVTVQQFPAVRESPQEGIAQRSTSAHSGLQRRVSCSVSLRTGRENITQTSRRRVRNQLRAAPGTCSSYSPSAADLPERWQPVRSLLLSRRLHQRPPAGRRCCSGGLASRPAAQKRLCARRCARCPAGWVGGLPVCADAVLLDWKLTDIPESSEPTLPRRCGRASLTSSSELESAARFRPPPPPLALLPADLAEPSEPSSTSATPESRLSVGRLRRRDTGGVSYGAQWDSQGGANFVLNDNTGEVTQTWFGTKLHKCCTQRSF